MPKILNKVKAKNVLMRCKTILDKENIEFFLVQGTLLGCIREQNFISHDCDIDIAIFYTPLARMLTIAAMIKSGFMHENTFSRGEEICEDSFYWKDIKIDIFWYRAEASRVYTHVFKGQVGKTWNEPLHAIVYEWKPFALTTTQFLGFTFNVPDDTIEFLEAHYGKNWKKPDTKWEYWSSPINARQVSTDGHMKSWKGNK